MFVQFLNASGENAGGIDIYQKTAPQYASSHCGSNTDFDSDAFEAISKLEGQSVIWTIKKTPGQGEEESRIEIKLNDVVIAYLIISEETCSHVDWKNWRRKVKKIKFREYDTASSHYKLPEKCESLKTGWTNMETEKQFPVDKETTLTVSCTGSYELVGDSEITCNGNNEFLYDSAREPRCGELELE